MALCWERLYAGMASAKQEPGKGGCLSRAQSAGLVRRGCLRFGLPAVRSVVGRCAGRWPGSVLPFLDVPPVSPDPITL